MDITFASSKYSMRYYFFYTEAAGIRTPSPQAGRRRARQGLRADRAASRPPLFRYQLAVPAEATEVRPADLR